jgi:hypothetical protein
MPAIDVLIKRGQLAIANLDQPSEREQLGRLRRAALRVWIVALTDLQPP